MTATTTATTIRGRGLTLQVSVWIGAGDALREECDADGARRVTRVGVRPDCVGCAAPAGTGPADYDHLVYGTVHEPLRGARRD